MTECPDTSPLELVDAGARTGAAAAAELVTFLLDDFSAAIRAYARVTGSAELVPRDARTTVVFGPLDVCAAWAEQQARTDTGGTSDTPARLYAIIYAAEPVDGAACVIADARMVQAARAGGFIWCGGCLIGRAGAFARLTHSPRLGFWRRPVSEACDRVVAAARLGLSLPAAAQITGAGEVARVVPAQTAWPFARKRERAR